VTFVEEIMLMVVSRWLIVLEMLKLVIWGTKDTINSPITLFLILSIKGGDK